MADRMLGKVALVTGATSGLGKSIALAFLKEGAKIVATGKNPARMQALSDEVAELGLSDNMRTFLGNVTSNEDMEAAVKLCVDSFGTMNVLSHNAGIIDDFSPVDELTDEIWNKQIEVNLTGTMRVCRAALKYFVPNNIEASIVIITSNAAFESSTGGPAYTASKAGANALMKSIAYEYKRVGIRCNSICPGPFLTNIGDSAPVFNPRGSELHQATGYNAHAWEWTGGEIGFPDEHLAPLAVYLASDESAFMNGNSCVIDAGVCLSR